MSEELERTVPRRGVLFGGLAVVGAIVARTPGTAEAGHNGTTAYASEGVVHMDVTNSGGGSTRISSNQSATATFVALNNYPSGVSRPDGILGRTSYSTSNCAGVAGSSESATLGIGVLGTSDAASGIGVMGFAGSNVPGPPNKPEGAGVFGMGPAFGGVFRAIGSGGGLLVEGLARVVGATRIEGDLVVTGQITGAVAGPVGPAGPAGPPGASGAPGAPGANGVPSLTAPSPLVEEFGEARLRAGRVTVGLPAAFLAAKGAAQYQIVLTEYGDGGGLYVSRRSATGFTVRSRKTGSRIRFGYRLVARRP